MNLTIDLKASKDIKTTKIAANTIIIKAAKTEPLTMSAYITENTAAAIMPRVLSVAIISLTVLLIKKSIQKNSE